MFRLYCIPWKNCHMSNSNVNSLLIIKVAELADVIKFILAKNQEEILHRKSSENYQQMTFVRSDQDPKKICNIQTFQDWCLIGQKRDCHGKITDVLFPSWSSIKEQFEPLFLMSFCLVSLMLTLWCSLLLPSLQSERSEKSCSDYKTKERKKVCP